MERRCARKNDLGEIKDLLRISTITLCLFLWTRVSCADSAKDSNSGNQQTELAAARAKFRSKIVADTLAQSGPASLSPPPIFQTIHYNAPVGPCVAYITPNPSDGKKHPAVLWAHGGYGGIDSYFWTDQPATNDQSARAFREAGLILMIPSWRGENDNPGKFEMFYGEVDDLFAARNYLAGLPYIDPRRIYLAGHSTGGTLALLAAESGNGFRATFSLGGVADLKKRLTAGRTQTVRPLI
jgi:dipeptidyl aminopeptidase/acylaminoacyl peptidase